jgi:transposase
VVSSHQSEPEEPREIPVRYRPFVPLPEWVIEVLPRRRVAIGPGVEPAFPALLPPRQDRHPLGCHRPRIDDRIVLDKIVQALVFGCGHERLADATCSATTLRRRRDEWIAAGVFDALRRSVLAADERLIGLDLGRLYRRVPD